jgi:[ribosomal protein S18]-alanine N-acetyltransferase
VTIRPGSESDFSAIRNIQELSPEASQWEPAGYNLLVAEHEGSVAGFLLWRLIAQDEAEVLNLAVSPAYRRRGIALQLIRNITVPAVFLEVRESNRAARALYRRAGFQESGTRLRYYDNPAEDAIVMRLQS